MKALLGAVLIGAVSMTPVLAQGVDPLAAQVRSEDARRFAAVFQASGGAPSPAELQAGYLDGAGRGVEIFTRGRIGDAKRLAAAVAADPGKYRRAIDVCLPLAEEASADLRSIYLGLQGMFPDRPLPEIHVVFGAGNSGGTAGPGAQVLGLEVICEIAQTPEEIRERYRQFFAHETVHVLQMGQAIQRDTSDMLLSGAMAEGFADFVVHLVTGEVPSTQQDAWARGREAELWAQFQADRQAINAAVAAGADPADPPAEVRQAYFRWLANFRSAPEGWPHEVGYWVGRQIAQSYFDRADDKRAAINALMRLEDPVAILEASGYAARFEQARETTE